ncbi:DUF5412 family protein [Alteribacter aurantiacus]|uniref:DUF5412 family protein n=1 Tax=Alteribacter aurantiacus TaxID=254410 RepID=UPI0003F4B9D2|nr:DUF5412 family protein [Alteribacter aurantiacus]
MRIKKVVIIVMFFIVASYSVYWAFFDWSRFKQELIAESTSPDGTYTINAYLNNEHATAPFTVLGELVFNNEKKRSKKIYWDKTDRGQIEWMDNTTVVINGVKIHLPDETYDFREVQ